MEIKNKIGNAFDFFINGLATLCLLVYGLSAYNSDILPQSILLPFAFLLGSAGIITLANIHFKFSLAGKESRYYKTGIIFLILAFFELTVMLTVQQSIILSNTKTEIAVLNSIHLGMDIAFDIFYSIGIMFVSVGFITENLYSVLGWYGVTISILLLTFNLITFPIPPKDMGLFDLGVFTVIWWFILILKVKSKKIELWQRHLAK